MASDKVFRTKTGFCHVLPDRLVLSRDEELGDDAALVNASGGISKALVLYALAAGWLLYKAYGAYRGGQMGEALLFLGVAVVFFLAAARSLNNSTASVIERSRIRAVHFISSAANMSLARFEVLFADGSGRVRKRLILLPGLAAGGAAETQKAVEIMRAENLLTQP
jgi:hypothetical protein